jgi:hypothetical protein
MARKVFVRKLIMLAVSKRIYVDAEHGIPFLSGSEIISLRPRE